MRNEAKRLFSWYHSINLIKLNHFCSRRYLKNLKNKKDITKIVLKNNISRHFLTLPPFNVKKDTSTKFATVLCLHLILTHDQKRFPILNIFWESLQPQWPPEKPLNLSFFKPEVMFQKSGSTISIPDQYLPIYRKNRKCI